MAAIWDSQAMGTTTGIPCSAEPPRPVRMAGRTERQQGARGESEGYQGPPKRYRDPPLVIGSPC